MDGRVRDHLSGASAPQRGLAGWRGHAKLACAALLTLGLTATGGPGDARAAGSAGSAGGVGGVGSAGSAGGVQAPPQPDAGLEARVVSRIGQELPLDIAVRDEAGRATTLRSVFVDGKPVVLVMAYLRCPLLCPLLLSTVRERLNQVTDLWVGRDYSVVVVSFDPTDTPELAARTRDAEVAGYVHNTGDPGQVTAHWRVLLARSVEARRLADALGFAYRYLPESGEFAHPTVWYVLTPDGRISADIRRLDTPASTLRLMLVEASQGRLGSLVDGFLLWCFTLDQHKGAYVVEAFRAMQVGGALTLVAVGGLLGRMALIERRRRRALAAAAAAGVDTSVPGVGVAGGVVAGGVVAGWPAAGVTGHGRRASR